MLKKCLLLYFVLLHSSAFAVPTWFLLAPSGNQRDVNWSRIDESRFSVYFDEKAEPLARYALKAVNEAYPYYTEIFGSHPGERVPVILSTRSDGGGFANFVTMNIETQVATGGTASFFQHELAHRFMYDVIDLKIGPAGRAISLAVLPSWWTEGLAEYLADSIGKTSGHSIGRTLALKNSFPSWDRLHALYNANEILFLKGYVTSGRFFKFVVQKLKPGKTIAELHDRFVHHLILPPFINASDAVLEEFTGFSGEELFEQFKETEKKSWVEQSKDLPSIEKLPLSKTSLVADGLFRVQPLQNRIVYSGLTDEHGSSFFGAYDLKSKKFRSRSTKIEGTGILRLREKEKEFWTTRVRKFSNGTSATEVAWYQYKGEWEKFEDKAIQKKFIFPTGSQQAPERFYQIHPTGPGTAFALSILRGESFLSIFDVKSKTVKKIKSFPIPQNVKFATTVQGYDDKSCVTLIIDHDKEETSLEQVCYSDKVTEKVLIPAKQLVIQDAIQKSSDQFLLLTANGSFQTLVEWNAGVAETKAQFVDWIQMLETSPDNKKLYAWSFTGNDYHLVEFEKEELFKVYAEKTGKISPVKTTWQEYQPPFKSMANVKNNETKANEVEATPATIRSRHLMTYPNIVPPMLGGWSLGILSVPLMDEMERYRVEAYGFYSALSGAASAQVRYVNMRTLDGWSVSTFSRERFNGLYYIFPCVVNNQEVNCISKQGDQQYTRYSILRESGFETDMLYKFRPTSLWVSGKMGLKKLQPMFGETHSFIGAQSAWLQETSGDLGFALWDRTLRVERLTQEGTKLATWRGNLSLGVTHAQSIGDVADGQGQKIGALRYQKVRAQSSAQWGWDDHNIVLRGGISGTIGKDDETLLSKELYQPYRTYLVGTGDSINNLNYSFTGDGKIFNLYAGNWAYNSSLGYIFPIVSDIDQKILISYVESLQGEVIIGRGGVASNKEFSDVYSVASASAAMRLNVDIKGFKINPAFAYGKLLGQPGWSFFFQLSFSQFL